LGQAGSVDLRRQAFDLEALLFGESVVGGIWNLIKTGNKQNENLQNFGRIHTRGIGRWRIYRQDWRNYGLDGRPTDSLAV
jgi:hypothetical protein